MTIYTDPKTLIGTTAPDFTAPASGNQTLRLSDFLGKKVVLYFYPRDMTPGCTTQLCDFTNHYPQITHKNAVVLGISQDSPEKHDRFIAKHNGVYDLISDDKDATICKKYGVWHPKKFMGKQFLGIVRTTFIIDEKGKITHAISPVKVKNHTLDILSML